MHSQFDFTERNKANLLALALSEGTWYSFMEVQQHKINECEDDTS